MPSTKSATLSVLLLLATACASNSPNRSAPAGTGPSLTGFMPGPVAADDDVDPNGAPTHTVLPIGVGLSTGPSSTLLTGSLDFPLDDKVTFGPSLQYGFDGDVTITTLTGQVKYFLPLADREPGKFSVLPYATAGVGIASIDKDGRTSDSGLLINAGAGLRYMTGSHYRLGSEVRVNFLPDTLGGEGSFMTFDLLQVIISF